MTGFLLCGHLWLELKEGQASRNGKVGEQLEYGSADAVTVSRNICGMTETVEES